ncbi:type II toxin-antitoxin system Phd/YefM family antitoxin [Oscillatoria salina]|uniref:type II toxin-antitoxin system Phd/YefM family antitoxin n=1 Tax=Oscillatoria salina TaxID=331517 RepID=UPI0013B731AE|nr:type II toxin-antitoxin system prevent-host-death family antitoxin [Oscillatoria salina]MBZ8180145.1 type II toxin-antitoxin system Phd/YefM family antitoxin [Oscillatoria salina IIICB1]NET88617.1 type II toxin-antitoxin system Phd/YefM family antitoxin [Kamptonema sp. SIO1D9]
MYQIDLAQAEQQLSELIEAATKGEEVVITKNNQPIAKLVPITKTKKSYPAKAGSAKGLVWIADNFDEPIEKLKV